ncbi:hypothetical protein CRE_10219 [Caenorhabditis remanei]|uniref:Uncharacterized protein n=1 Tax=Caenorhabditis remanei TaxID=31234 RepID=E3M707_CAERE|nr:hypothetical protein CRE_10219 [Caenorhabditis remanei]
MSLPFLKFPGLVQIEVIKQLELRDVFWMSLCSKHMKHVIRSAELRPKRVHYLVAYNRIQVALGFLEHNDNVHPLVLVRRISYGDTKDLKKMKMGGATIKSRFIKSTESKNFNYYLEYLHSEQNVVINSLQLHINYIFRNEPRVQINVYCTDSLSLSTLIKNAKDSFVIQRLFSTATLEYFLKRHPTLESLHIKSNFTDEKLQEDAKLWKLDRLAFRNSEDMTPMLMRKFNGRYMILDNSNYSKEFWQELIRKWIRRESYHNLQAVITRTHHNLFRVINWREFWAECNAMKWDGLRRPKHFKFDPKIIDFGLYEPEEIDCSDYIDIQQTGGGKWASIRDTGYAVHFFVWD